MKNVTDKMRAWCWRFEPKYEKQWRQYRRFLPLMDREGRLAILIELEILCRAHSPWIETVYWHERH